MIKFDTCIGCDPIVNIDPDRIRFNPLRRKYQWQEK